MAENTALVPAPTPVPLTYRERLAQFRIVEEKRCELIEELLDKLEKTEAKLAQTELDLRSEQNVRRTLQAEIVEAKEKETTLAEKQAKRPFVLILIDADAEGIVFQDKYLTQKTKGGESLADEILLKTREYLRPLYPDADSLDILVRIFSNLEGMANIMVREGLVRSLGSLRAVSTGFSSRINSFDWIDVGVGKEGTSARKVRENLSFYTSNTHLRQVILGCHPSDLPSTLLSTLPTSQITLLETHPLPSSLTTAPHALRTTKFPTIFRTPTPASPRTRARGTTQLQLTQQEDVNGGSTWLVIQPERSRSQGGGRHGEVDAGGWGRGPNGRGERGGSGSEEDSRVSISFGREGMVSVDGGRRRR